MSFWRCLLHWLRAAALYGSGAMWWAKRQLRRERSIVVLTLHRVLADADMQRTDSIAGIVMSRTTFDRLTAYLAARYSVVPTGCGDSGNPRQLRVALTFDDGWRDIYENAFAIARSRALPFTVFVCPGLVGRDAPFWPERVGSLMKRARHGNSAEQIEATIARLKLYKPSEREAAVAELYDDFADSGASGESNGTLFWEQLIEMHEAGVTIASHGYSHEILTLLPEAEAELEIQRSQRVLEERLNSRRRVFAYPNGNHSPQVRRLLAANGYERAFSTQLGAWNQRCDPLAIPRINVYDGNLIGPSGRFSGLMFEYTVFWRAWRAGC